MADNTDVTSGGNQSAGHGAVLSGTTRLTDSATLTIAGNVVSQGTLENAGTITIGPEPGDMVRTRLAATSADSTFTPRTLATTRLVGQGGTINMRINLSDPEFQRDMLVIDGGQVTGKTWLNFTHTGADGLGLATTGDGLRVVDAINGSTTDAGALSLARKLQPGVAN
ncbi:autotransporter adhesin Ag43, partial [Citrobacter sp. VF227]